MTFYQLINENRCCRIINKIVITLKTVKNYLVSFRDYIKYSKTDLISLCLYSGQKLTVRSNSVDAHDAVTVLSGQEYPYHLFKDILSSKATIFDIGAHLGAFTLYIKAQLPNSYIYAFEPASDNFLLLEKNVRQNKLINIKIFQKAVAANSGQVFLNTTGRDSNAYQLSATGVAVSSVSLDDFLRTENITKIDLIKLDCEGSEYEILSNFKNINQVKAIILEYHKQNSQFNSEYLINFLTNNNFSLQGRRDLRDKSRGILFFTNNK